MIEQLKTIREALKRLLDRDMRNTCQHDNTHRGGVLWEICDDCGMKWADDRGGKPEWKDPPEWAEAEAAIAALAQLEAMVGEQQPVAWMYDWLPAGGPTSYDWISSSKAEVFAPENCYFNIRPLYTAAPVAQQPSDDWVLIATNAYEAGFGKGEQAAERGVEISNPWSDEPAREAWAIGYELGKERYKPAQQPQASEAEDAACWRWLSEHIDVAWSEGGFTRLVRIVSDKHRAMLTASVKRMMAGDWSDAQKHQQPQAEKRCQYCDGSGDVHSIDGQWRGECHCQKQPQAEAVPSLSPICLELSAEPGCRYKGLCVNCAAPQQAEASPETEVKESHFAPAQAVHKRATGWVAPKDRYTTPVLFNPYTGEPRNVLDVQSDPQGILIVPPGALMLAAQKGGT